MVDEERQRQRADHRREFVDVLGVEVQHDVPAAAFHLVDDLVEHAHVRHAAEMLDEIETHATHAAGVELIKLLVGNAVIDHGDAAIAFRIGGQTVHHRRIVEPVAAGLHDHGAIDAEIIVQRAQHFLRRIFRGVFAGRRIGKHRAGPEHVAVRIGAARRQFEFRFAALGEEFRSDVHCGPFRIFAGGIALWARSDNPARRPTMLASYIAGMSPCSQPAIVAA